MPRRPDSDLGPLERAKTRLRRRMHQRRAELDPVEAEPAGRRVSEFVIATPEFAAASRVALYAALDDELPRRFLFDAVLSPGRDALLPRIELWSKPFAEWTDDDWQTCGYSALWDVTTGRVLWAEGAHEVAEMPEVGKPFDEFFGVS